MAKTTFTQYNIEDGQLEKRAWTMFGLLQRLDLLIATGNWPDPLTNLLLQRLQIFHDIQQEVSTIHAQAKQTQGTIPSTLAEEE